MYYDFIQSHKRKIIMIVSVFLSILFIWSVVIIAGRIGKIPVIVSIAPSHATITLNGQPISNGNQWIAPGEYTVIAQRDGFASKKHSVIIAEEKKDNVIAISLVPQSKSAKEWVAAHHDEYKDNEKYGALQASAEGEYLASKNPITKKLPFTDPYYTIGYTVTDNKSITVTIATTSPRYRFYAVEKIREWGYEPTDFIIVFKDFHNPLEKS